tara:strand:- start:973 stop:3000 length:2028 start_codon:yes stop_codon:yes gene_type:complete
MPVWIPEGAISFDAAQLEAIIENLSLMVSKLCGISHDCYLIKEGLGTLHMNVELEASTRCTVCNARLYGVRVLCANCRRKPVTCKKGRPFVDVAWRGSHDTTRLNKEKWERVCVVEDLHSLAQTSLRLSDRMERQTHAILDEYGDCNVDIRMFGIPEWQCWRSCVKPNETQKLSAMGVELSRALQVHISGWLHRLDLSICNHFGINDLCKTDVDYVQQKEDLRIAKNDLCILIASRITMTENNEDDSPIMKLSPDRLEYMCHVEFNRCQLSVHSAIRRDLANLRYMQSILHNGIDCSAHDLAESEAWRIPASLQVKELRMMGLPDSLVDYMNEIVDDYAWDQFNRWRSECKNAAILRQCVDAVITMLEEWQPPKSFFMRTIQRTCVDDFDSQSVLSPITWSNMDGDQRWKLISIQTGTKACVRSGVNRSSSERIVRMVCAVWEMAFAGPTSTFPVGVLLASIVNKVSRVHRAHSSTMCEFLIQEAQPLHIAKDFERARLGLSLNGPLVEDEILDALSHMASFSLAEVGSALNMYRNVIPFIANKAASYISRMLNPDYRGFVEYVLPIGLALLSHNRQAARISINSRENQIVSVLRCIPAIRQWEAKAYRTSDFKDTPPMELSLGLQDIGNGRPRELLEWFSAQRTLCRRHRCKNRVIFTVNCRDLALIINQGSTI